jgi:hypothetical protein
VITIIQGTIVLAVVVANEIAGRITRRAAERASRQSSGPPADDSMTSRRIPGVVSEGTP